MAGGGASLDGQPLAYVTNSASNSVSVIDTGDDTVVDTVLVGNGPEGLAVAPDGKHVYVAISTDNDLAVIDTTSDKVVKTVSVAGGANRVAVTPDGKRVYVTGDSGAGRAFVTVIDTTSDKVVNTVAVAGGANDVAVTPDGKRVYVTGSYAISVIDATSDMVVATIPNVCCDAGSDDIAIAPDGKHAYTTNSGAAHAGCFTSVIDTVTKTNTFGTRLTITGYCAYQLAITPNGKYIYVPLGEFPAIFAIKTATNTIDATVPFAQSPIAVAITPDGRRAYVTAGNFNTEPNSVVVIETRTNSIIATIAVPSGTAIAIIPPPQGIEFLAFKARLDINFGHKPRGDGFDLESEFTLSSTVSNGIHPESEPVKLQVGPFIATIPAGSFREHGDYSRRSYRFEGVIDGVRLEAQIKPTGTLRYAFQAEAKGANLSGTNNPVQVSLRIGDDAGLTSVKADLDRPREAFDDETDHQR